MTTENLTDPDIIVPNFLHYKTRAYRICLVDFLQSKFPYFMTVLHVNSLPALS